MIVQEDLGTYETLPLNIFLALTLGSYKLEVNISLPVLLRCKVNNAFLSCLIIPKRSTSEHTHFVSVRLSQVDRIFFYVVIGFVQKVCFTRVFLFKEVLQD